MSQSILPPLVHEHKQHGLVVASCVALGMIVVVGLLYWLSISISPAPSPASTMNTQIAEALSQLRASKPANEADIQNGLRALSASKSVVTNEQINQALE